ncbi:MAG: hypothetical protein PHR82_05305 [Endomicrobiaceae bacterium]|nr:hypothetical protein [Endomicrobiaceae bacterium]
MTNHFFKYEFVYIFLFCSFIFLTCSVFVKNKTIKLIGILFFSLFFALGIWEFILYSPKLVCQFNIPKKFSSKTKIFQDDISILREILTEDQYNNFEFERYPGFCKEINVNRNNNKVIYDVCYSLLPSGFRYTKCNWNSDNIYVFLGGSFTFGSGLNDNETLPYYFSKLMNFGNNVLNLGLGAKGSTTALNILNNDIINKFIEKKPVKLFIYNLINGHSDRNFNVLEFGAKDNWALENNKWRRLKQPFGNIKIIFARSYIFKKIFSPIIEEHNRAFYDKYLLGDLKKIDKIVRVKYNSKLTIIVWPDVFYMPDIVNELKNANIDTVILPGYFMLDEKYRIRNDRHPNAKANEEIANILMEHINNKNKI